jgi:hypothetical protein
VARSESDYVIPLDKAEARLLLAQLTGHRDLEVPIERVDKSIDFLKRGNISALEREIREIKKLPTSLIQKVNFSVFDERMRKLKNFLEWYKTQPSFHLIGIQTPDFLRVATIVMKENLRPGLQARTLNSLLWHPEISDAELDSGIGRAAELLEIKNPLLELTPPKTKCVEQFLEKALAPGP